MTAEQSEARSDVDVAVDAVRAGAVVLNAMFGSELTQDYKTDLDFSTEADAAAEQAILDVIQAARPDDGFEGEELGAVHSGARRTWWVDPLCGTLNFAAESPAFCVNVALVDAGVTTTAAVGHPPTGEVYWASGDEFGVLGRDGPAPPNRLVNINADSPLDRDFVGAQLAADCIVTDFDENAVHSGPGIIAARDVESHAALVRLVAGHRSH